MRSMTLQETLGKKTLIFDGAMGTELQKRGLPPGQSPEIWNVTHPHIIESIHKEYLLAGCQVIKTNTFGANPLKLTSGDYSPEMLIQAGVARASQAIRETRSSTSGPEPYILLDMGPTGKMMEPLGSLSFEQAYESFAQVVKAGVKQGVHGILLETFSHLYEMKAAILATKENSNLPILVSAVLDEQGHLSTGGDILSFLCLCESLRVDAIGFNCGFGPEQMVPFIETLVKHSSLPVFANPNGGLPRMVEGKTEFDLPPQDFTQAMMPLISLGLSALGGCCGTTPSHLKQLGKAVTKYGQKASPLVRNLSQKCFSYGSSYGKVVCLGEQPLLVGEKINPTGNKEITQALQQDDFSPLLRLAVEQKKAGAHILDVNVGLPEIDEVKLLPRLIKTLQKTVDLPLMIDTTNAQALEQALRCYNGKALINSVSGKKQVMEEVFPLVAKYGGLLVALLLDDEGIPETAQQRLAIAKKIIAQGKKYGIKPKDFLFDPLAMTVSSHKEGPKITLETLSALQDEGFFSVVGVSNISYGLPGREAMNGAFLSLLLHQGASAAITDPLNEKIMDAYHAHNALFGWDEHCSHYIATYGKKIARPRGKKTPLQEFIIHGLNTQGEKEVYRLLEEKSPLTIINDEIVPALTAIGDSYQQGEVFLPQLLLSAECATSAFDILKHKFSSDLDTNHKGKIVLATVYGDVHDIGKNIIKVLLESHGYEIIDLGKNVAPQQIITYAKKPDVKIVGLSALMTTTLPAMEETIQSLRKQQADCHIMVGGAVVTEEYAKKIGADSYANDALEAVEIAKRIL